MGENRFSAIVLAAGFSSRMSGFKPLLKLGEKTVIEQSVNLFFSAGIKDVRVVTGFQRELLDEPLKQMNIQAVYNSDYEQGMITSVKAGIGSLYYNDCEAFFIHPVDIPLVRPDTVEKLKNTYNKHDLIYYPVYRGERGHPTIISSELAWDILHFNGQGGLKEFLKDYENKAVDVQVDDEFILLDCDTPDDYQRLLMHINDSKNKIPTASDCIDILKRALPDDGKIVEHCMQVAALALHFAKAVGMTEDDIKLVIAGALLHDISRKEKGHAKAGAAAINQIGYPAVAEIIKAHVDIDVDNNRNLDATQIVYLADKLVKRTTIVSLEARFHDKIHGQDRAAAEAAERRLINARKIQQRLEAKTGKSMEEIMSGFNDKEYYDLFT